MKSVLYFTIIPFHLLAILVPVSAFVLFKWPRALHHMFALFLGTLVGYINLHTDEAIFPVLLLIAFGFFLGFAHQGKILLCAILLAMWIPIGQLVQLFVETKQDTLAQDFLFSMIAFAPALIGSYAGVALHKVSFRPSAAHS